MQQVDEHVQPAGLSHESGLVLTAAQMRASERRGRAALELVNRGFRAEHFMAVPEGAVRTWGLRFPQLESIRYRIERLRRAGGGENRLDARWGEDGWWKSLGPTVAGEQGMCIRLGGEKRFYMSEQQVGRVVDAQGMGFAAYGTDGKLLLEVRGAGESANSARRRSGGDQAWNGRGVTQVARRNDQVETRVAMANRAEVPEAMWMRSVDAYAKTVRERRPDPMVAMFIGGYESQGSYELAVGIAIRLEALLAWEVLPGRRALKDFAPGGLRAATMKDIVEVARTCKVQANSAGPRFDDGDLEEMVARHIAES